MVCLAVDTLLGDTVQRAPSRRSIDQELGDVLFQQRKLRDARVDDPAKISVAAEELKTLRIVWQRFSELLCPLERPVRQTPEVNKWVSAALVVKTCSRC